MKPNVLESFDQVMKNYNEILTKFPWENRFAYAMWLRQTAFFVQHSTRLINLTGSRFPLTREHLHLRFIEYCREEKGHDKMLLKDIKSLNYTVEELNVLDTTKSFLYNQYYWIEHINPMAFFGYILFLEGLAITHSKNVIQRVTKAFGEKSYLFLRVHAEEDIEHVKKAFTVVSEANEEEAHQIIENLKISATLYHQSLIEIEKMAHKIENNQKKKAS